MLKNKEKICGLAAGLVVAITFASGSVAKNLPQAEARYNSESDTDATILDYVENRRRNARENALNEDQKQLLLDAYEMKENLREPLDPTKNVPVAVEGDELFYDENTGDFVVQGNVVMTSLDKRRFITEHADGRQGLYAAADGCPGQDYPERLQDSVQLGQGNRQDGECRGQD